MSEPGLAPDYGIGKAPATEPVHWRHGGWCDICGGMGRADIVHSDYPPLPAKNRQWLRDVDGRLVNLAHVRGIKVDTWAGDDYGVAAKPFISVIASIDSKEWAVLARGFDTTAAAQAWLDDQLGWLAQ